MKFSQCVVSVILLSLLPSFVHAQQAVKLQGVWEMVSQKIDGKDHPIPGRQIKLLTGTHYTWVRHDKKQIEEFLAKGTEHDSILAYMMHMELVYTQSSETRTQKRPNSFMNRST